MERLQSAEQFRRAVQMFARSLSDTDAMEVSCIYPAWQTGKEYSINDLLTYGENGVGDPQLYRVLQAHISQEEWTPDTTEALYKAVGVKDGYPEWSQPVGASDAYMIGDIVSYNSGLYICISDYCVYPPDVYGWEVYVGE